MNDTSYFKHDNNSRNDLKLVMVRQKHGILGYGIYFCILEMLCCHKNYKMKTDYTAISFELQEDKKIIEDIVRNYGLFKIKRNTFWSEPFIERMRILNNIRKGWQKGGKNRWKNRDDNEGDFRKP